MPYNRTWTLLESITMVESNTNTKQYSMQHGIKNCKTKKTKKHNKTGTARIILELRNDSAFDYFSTSLATTMPLHYLATKWLNL